MRQVILYRGKDEYWITECPSLPGCISQGLTKEEAAANVEEAIEGYIAALEVDDRDYLDARGARGSRVAFDRAMGKVADIEPEKRDRL